MPQVGFEPTIPVFKRAKTVHVLVRAAIVIDLASYTFQFTQMEQLKITVLRYYLRMV
jgi:hypothetical protein